MIPRPVIEVVCAVIRNADGRVLAGLCPPGHPLDGKWEFPGGKIEPGETAEAALVREIQEELGCEITVGAPLAPATHANERRTILLRPFLATVVDGVPVAVEHRELRWVTALGAAELEWAEADQPIAAEVFSAGP